METGLECSLFDAITDSAVLLDRTGRIVDWNQGAALMFGYSKKDILGRSINLLYQHTLPISKIIQDLLSKKKWESETSFIRKNGDKGFCKSQASLLTSSEQNKKLIFLTHQNISFYKNTETDLKNKVAQLQKEVQNNLGVIYSMQSFLIKTMHAFEHLEKNLRESEVRFHLLAENSTDSIAQLTPNGHYLYISPSCKTLLGYKQEELIGSSIYKLIHHEDISKLKKMLHRRKDTGTSQIVTYRIRKKEAEYRWFESNIRIVRDDQTHIIREVHIASRDVTDRILDKKARLRGQQLAHVFRLSTMEEMASGMAHEISQPLAAVVNYTQGCVRYLQTNHDKDQLAEIMKKAVFQAERAGQVIHRLKNFFCKGQVFRSPCKINSLIRETVGLIRSDLNNSKTKIDFELEKNVPLISADKIQLQQVMINLIQNAIDAMEDIHVKERRLHIQCKLHEVSDIEVIFKDNGPGFSKELIHKVFEPFFTTKAHGRGMGLAICRSIIEAHGGKFTINPNTNNHSWIRFTLPIN